MEHIETPKSYLSQLKITVGWYGSCCVDDGPKAKCNINGKAYMLSNYQLERLHIINHMAGAYTLATGKFKVATLCYDHDCEYIEWNDGSPAVSINGDSNKAVIYDIARHICGT